LTQEFHWWPWLKEAASLSMAYQIQIDCETRHRDCWAEVLILLMHVPVQNLVSLFWHGTLIDGNRPQCSRKAGLVTWLPALWLQHYTAGEIQWQEISVPGQEDSIAHFCPCSPTAVIIAITAWKIQFDRVSPQSASFSWINWQWIKIISGKPSIKFKTDVNDFFVHQVIVQPSSAKPTQITEHNTKKGIGSSRSGRYTHKLF
jgi:hypothetical protein